MDIPKQLRAAFQLKAKHPLWDIFLASADFALPLTLSLTRLVDLYMCFRIDPFKRHLFGQACILRGLHSNVPIS